MSLLYVLSHVCFSRLHQPNAHDAVWTCNLVYALQIDFMKRQGLLDKTFNRRRDEQSMYMEESCKFKHLMKRAGATAATAKA